MNSEIAMLKAWQRESGPLALTTTDLSTCFAEIKHGSADPSTENCAFLTEGTSNVPFDDVNG